MTDPNSHMADPMTAALMLSAEVARMAREHFRRLASGLGLTQPQWQLMLNLSRTPGLTQVGLAERLDVHPVTVTQALDRLSRAGWVRRERHPGDRRAFRVYLTDAAEPVLGELQAMGMATNEVALAGLSENERRQLASLLEHIKANLGMARAAMDSQGGVKA